MATRGRTVRQTIRELKAIQGKSQTVINRLMSDAKTRVPGWIASEVTQVYNIKKSELLPGKVSKSVGSIKVDPHGDGSVDITYKGRPLTPTHFGMTPKAPKNPGHRSTYTLKYEAIKGRKTVLGKNKKLTKKQARLLGKNFRREGPHSSPQSPIMLLHTGAGSADKVQYIPFQRTSQARNDLHPVKRLSLPQMVSSHRTQEKINQAINEGMAKRMAQHMKLLEK